MRIRLAPLAYEIVSLPAKEEREKRRSGRGKRRAAEGREISTA